MSIALIAPYEELRSMALEVIAENNYQAEIYAGDMSLGVRAAEKARENGAQILISRGGTAILIRETLRTEVIEIRPSVYSAFAYINAHTTSATRIAIAGFSPLVNTCRPVCDILRRTYETFEIRSVAAADEAMRNAASWKPDIVVGDAIAVRLAKSLGLRTHIIESSRETLVEAFEQAGIMASNLRRHIANERRLSMLLNCTQEGALLLDTEGGIRDVNRRGLELLGAERDGIVGLPLRSVFPAESVEPAIRERKNVKNGLLSLDGRQYVFDFFCVGPDMEIDSGVVLFQPVEHVQQKENSIRTKLIEQGFYARYSLENIVHESGTMRECVETAKEYAKTDCNIMLLGETGTGKELFAQGIHNAGARAGGPFVAVNCAALPGTLLESELFGYAPGAFTGALRSGKIGLFEMAHNGTLFLDEIAEMDVFLQARLLRTLQTRQVRRIGDSKIIPVDVRIIAATNKNPEEEVRLGKMRADLFFRLNVLDLRIPPLRDREKDIPLLFHHCLEVYSKRYGSRVNPPPEKFIASLQEYPWPGNVRELENMAEKYVTLGSLPPKELPRARTGAGAGVSPEALPDSLAAAMKKHVRDIVRREKGNIARSAARLDVDRNTVRRWLAKE